LLRKAMQSCSGVDSTDLKQCEDLAFDIQKPLQLYELCSSCQ
jgi:hypothetical protein